MIGSQTQVAAVEVPIAVVMKSFHLLRNNASSTDVSENRKHVVPTNTKWLMPVKVTIAYYVKTVRNTQTHIVSTAKIFYYVKAGGTYSKH